MPQAGSTRLQITIDQLEQILTPAFEQMHWGLLKIINEITALNATALLDDDRTAEIHAQKAADGGVHVQVRVGYFGDEKLEQQFLAELRHRAAALRPDASS